MRMRENAHGCKLFYCERRRGYVCCADCGYNPEQGGYCENPCMNTPKFCNQQTLTIKDKEGKVKKKS